MSDKAHESPDAQTPHTGHRGEALAPAPGPMLGAISSRIGPAALQRKLLQRKERSAAAAGSATVVQRKGGTFMETRAGMADITQMATGPLLLFQQYLERLVATDTERAEDLELVKTCLKKRALAKARIDAFESDAKSADPRQFKDITKAEVVQHVRTTVDEPGKISQAETKWCGANMFIIVMAQKDPLGYVNYVIDLFTTGAGKLGKGMTVTPGRDLKSKYTDVTQGDDDRIKGADWISIGSLRDSENSFRSAASKEGADSFTTPGELVKWFGRYGVADKDIVDTTSYVSGKNAVDLLAANTYLQSGHNVIMWVNGNTCHQDGELKIDGWDWGQGHWVILAGEISSNDDTFFGKVITWGSSSKQMRIKKSKVAGSFGGFVAVNMQSQVKAPYTT